MNTPKNTRPWMKRELDCRYEEAVQQLPSALASEGFGILTEIDFQETLKKKLNVPYRRHKLFGACNPSLAYSALTVTPEVGTLLPCNIAVYENDTGRAVITAVDPGVTMASDPREELQQLASEVRAKLARVLERLG